MAQSWKVIYPSGHTATVPKRLVDHFWLFWRGPKIEDDRDETVFNFRSISPKGELFEMEEREKEKAEGISGEIQ